MTKNLLFAMLMLFSLQSVAQTITITGVVKEYALHEPLMGCNVIVQGATTGTVCDMDGKYSITASVGDVLQFIYIGMKKQEIKITETTKTIDVLLEDDYPFFCGPIYYSYTEQNRIKDLSSANTPYIISSQWDGRPNLAKTYIDGYWSGVHTSSNVDANSEQINIRSGATRIDGDVKYVVDGVPYAPFNWSDVHRMHISKDAASATVASSVIASGGVIDITTKANTYDGPVTSVNAWMGVQQVSDLISLDSKKNFDDNLRTGLVQHYDARFGKKLEKMEITGSVSYDDVEGALKSTSFRQLSTRFNAKTNLAQGLDLGQNLFYRQVKKREGYFSHASYYGSQEIDVEKPREQQYLATYLDLHKWQKVVKLKSLFSYEKEDLKYGSLTYGANTNYQMTNNSKKRYMWDNSATKNFTTDYGHNIYMTAHYNWMKTEYSYPSMVVGVSNEFANVITSDAILKGGYNFNQGTRTMYGSIRRHSSSGITKGHSYIYLPTISASWDIMKENFFDNISSINNVKLKAGWSKTASDVVSGYGNESMLPFFDDFADIAWMNTKQLSLGLDLILFNRGLYVSANYFRKSTDNVVTAQWPLSVVNGDDKVVNRGWEFEVVYKQEITHEWSVNVKGNLTTYNSSWYKGNDWQSNSLYSILGEYATPDYTYGLNVSTDFNKFSVSALMSGAANETLPWCDTKLDRLALRSLNVAYTMSLRGLYSSYTSTKAKFYVNGENLLTRFKYDSRANNSIYFYPLNRMISAGVKVTF